MNKPYDPTQAPMGPLGRKSNRRAMMIRHNKMVLARRLKAMRVVQYSKTYTDGSKV
jgi:hypothetical protein